MSPMLVHANRHFQRACQVTDGQAPLPGVTVLVSSPSLQGERAGLTNENGDYILRLLPPTARAGAATAPVSGGAARRSAART